MDDNDKCETGMGWFCAVVGAAALPLALRLPCSILGVTAGIGGLCGGACVGAVTATAFKACCDREPLTDYKPLSAGPPTQEAMQ